VLWKSVITDAKNPMCRQELYVPATSPATGLSPAKSAAISKKNKIPTISGNYDCKVLDVIKHGKSTADKVSKGEKRNFYFGQQNTIENLLKPFWKVYQPNIEEEMPAGRKLLVVHGSPISNDDDILSSITSNGIKAKLGDACPDILVCGHTHIPFVKRFGKLLIVNCGSAGQPVDGDPRPSYAIVSADEDTVHRPHHTF